VTTWYHDSRREIQVDQAPDVALCSVELLRSMHNWHFMGPDRVNVGVDFTTNPQTSLVPDNGLGRRTQGADCHQGSGPIGGIAMIEIGIHPDMPGAMIYHSTESGRFMPAGRQETIELFNAVKRGDFDGLFTDPPVHTSASAAAPASDQTGV
jgi:hypothetical protein